MKPSIKEFFSKCDQIRSFLVWSHLLKKFLLENFIFCAVLGISHNTEDILSRIALLIKFLREK